jgi:hypothetical protein
MNKNILTKDFADLTKNTILTYLYLDRFLKADGILSYEDLGFFKKLMQKHTGMPEEEVMGSLVELVEYKYFIHFDCCDESRNFGMIVRTEELRKELLGKEE